MAIVDQLDKLRHEATGCTLVAYADLRTRLVLCVSADNSPPHEALDRLCGQAVDCFDETDFVSSLVKEPETSCRSTQALEMTPKEARVFIRAATDDPDVLLCTCQSPEQADALIAKASVALQEITDTL